MISSLPLLRGILLLAWVTACRAAPLPTAWLGRSARNGLLRAPQVSLRMQASPGIGVGAGAVLTLRGGSDVGEGSPKGGGGEQMALTLQGTGCQELVSALMSSDNDVRAAAEKRYDELKVHARSLPVSLAALHLFGLHEC